MVTEVIMPRQGQSVESCLIIEWKVAEGDAVSQGDPICDIETDKAAFEIESPASGTVLGVFYPADSDVEVLKVIAAIGEPGEDIEALRPDQSPIDKEDARGGDSASEASLEPFSVTESNPAAVSVNRSSPRARKLATAAGVQIENLQGSGPEGRIIERDVQQAMPKSASPAARALSGATGLPLPSRGSGIGGRVMAADVASGSSASGPRVSLAEGYSDSSEDHPVRGIRKRVAERMHASLAQTAQLTHHASADARPVLKYREQCKASPERSGLAQISINHMVMLATARTLTEFPELNAHWLGDRIRRFEEVHLGMAVDTERGLVVPVLRHANRLSLRELAIEARRLAVACQDGSIRPDDMKGGTFTVTTLGALGIERFTPVLNAPEVGILGVGSIELKPVHMKKKTRFIPHMGLSLTFDHQAVDGAPAARFLAALREKLAAFELTLAA